MKTMQMTIVLTISLLIPALGFTQVHISTTTQAFTRTALTTNSIKSGPVVITSSAQPANTIETTDRSHTNSPAAAEKTTAVKARAKAESDITAAKQKVINVKPKTNASVSGDVKAGTKASVSNN